MLDNPKGFTDEVNNIIFDYIWNYKNPKLKKATIINNKKDGGLNMLDFTLFDNALKIVWVKRLYALTMKDHGNLFHYPYFPMLVAVFFSSATITFNIYP